MWQGIYGHDDVVERFRRTLAAGRLASTYLFVGTEGVGKRQFALKLAQSLLCTGTDDTTLDPCGKCPSCLMCLSLNHPDLHLVERERDAKYLKIKQFVGPQERRGQEGLCHDLILRPLMGRRRVAIIDDADWFNLDSANCLLKMLEEPPPDAVIILIGTSRSRQLPTILSRAQVVRFHALPLEIVQQLVRAEGLAPDDATARRIAEQSEGSLARARALADPVLGEVRDQVVAAWQAGDIDVARLAPAVDAFIAAGTDGEQRRGRFRLLLQLVEESLRAQLRQQLSTMDAAERTLAAIDRCLDAEEQVDRNANQATLLESWLADLADLASPAAPSPA